MKKNAKSSKKGSNSRSSSLMLPHGREVANHFSPAKIEEHGLGPAFFAVVIAIIALILLSIFGNNYLTGQYALHFDHVASPNMRFVNISFSPTNINLQEGVNFVNDGRGRFYSGWVTGYRVALSPVGLMSFNGSNVTTQAFVVVRNMSSRSPPPGTILLYTRGAEGYLWRISQVGTSGRVGIPVQIVTNVNLPLYSRDAVSGRYYPYPTELWPVPIQFVLRSYGGDLYLRNATIALGEFNVTGILANGSALYVPAGAFYVDWRDVRTLPFRLGNVTFSRNIHDEPRRIFPGFESPMGSKLLEAGDFGVTIQYAFDRRLKNGILVER